MSRLLQYLEKVSPEKFTNLYLEQMRDARFVPAKEDILNVMHFLGELHRRIYKDPQSFSPEALSVLKDYFDDLWCTCEKNYIPLWFGIVNVERDRGSLDSFDSFENIGHWFKRKNNPPQTILTLLDALEKTHYLFYFEPDTIQGTAYISGEGDFLFTLEKEDLNAYDLIPLQDMIENLLYELFHGVGGSPRDIEPFHSGEQEMEMCLTFKGRLVFRNQGRVPYTKENFSFYYRFIYDDNIYTDLYDNLKKSLMSFLYGG